MAGKKLHKKLYKVVKKGALLFCRRPADISSWLRSVRRAAILRATVSVTVPPSGALLTVEFEHPFTLQPPPQSC